MLGTVCISDVVETLRAPWRLDLQPYTGADTTSIQCCHANMDSVPRKLFLFLSMDFICNVQWCFWDTLPWAHRVEMGEGQASWLPGMLLEHSRLQRAELPKFASRWALMATWQSPKVLGGMWCDHLSLFTAHGGKALPGVTPLRSQAWTDTVFVYLRHFQSIFSLSLTACLQWVSAGGQFPSAVSFWITALARAAQYSIYLGRNYSIFSNLLLSWLHSTFFTPVKREKCLSFPPATLHFIEGWEKVGVGG